MPRLAKRKASTPADTSRLRNKRRALDESTLKPPLVPSAAFSTLPEEIVLEILDYFLNVTYRKDAAHALYCLCLTSRQLYRLSKPYLYSYVANSIVEPRKLLRTLIQEPQTAERVRGLNWRDDHGNLAGCWKRKDKKYALTHIERRELCKKVEELGLVNPRMYSRSFQMQRPKDHLAALLLLCPNIRSLDVCDTNVCCYPRGYHVAPPWIRLLGEVGFGNTDVLSQHFQHLTYIRIRLGPIRLLQIPPILNIRSLRVLMLEDAYEPDQPDSMYQWIWNFSVSPRSSPLECLYVQNSYIDSKALARLIGSIRALRLFCFDFDNSVRNGGYTLDEDDIPELHYPTLATALLEHKDTLERLTISDNPDPELNEIFDIDTGSLGSLRDLHKVRLMTVDLDCFGGLDLEFNDAEELLSTSVRPANLADNLPSSVEQLDLYISEDEDIEYELFWINCLEELAKTMKTRLPALEEVRVSRKAYGEIWIESEDLKSLQVQFADEGVLLTIVGEEEPFLST